MIIPHKNFKVSQVKLTSIILPNIIKYLDFLLDYMIYYSEIIYFLIQLIQFILILNPRPGNNFFTNPFNIYSN